jgi:sarcosine oxidase delta subunit
MPKPSKFRCPECGVRGMSETKDTTQVGATMRRDRVCHNCECQYCTAETVTEITKRGDAARVARAREAAKHRPRQLRMLVPHDEADDE